MINEFIIGYNPLHFCYFIRAIPLCWVVAPPPQPSDPVNGTPPLGGQVQPVSCALATCAASRNTAFAIKIGKLLWSLRMGANI